MVIYLLCNNFRENVTGKVYKSAWQQDTNIANFRWEDLPESEDDDAKEII